MLLAYLNALRRELVAFVMGSFPFAIVAVVEHVRGRSVAWPRYGIAVLCGFLVAGYRVWSKEHERAEKAEGGARLRLSFQSPGEPWIAHPPGAAFAIAGGPSYAGPPHSLFRVCVTNEGSEAAREVRVILHDVKPTPRHAALSRPLALAG
jgi:hypothetical protein